MDWYKKHRVLTVYHSVIQTQIFDKRSNVIKLILYGAHSQVKEHYTQQFKHAVTVTLVKLLGHKSNQPLYGHGGYRGQIL